MLANSVVTTNSRVASSLMHSGQRLHRNGNMSSERVSSRQGQIDKVLARNGLNIYKDVLDMQMSQKRQMNGGL